MRRALGVLALLVVAAPLRADYKEDYKKALEKMDAKTPAWSDVETLLRHALTEQPREGEQIKIYGMRFEVYMPHYYLGLARFKQGDCAGALHEWDISLSQGAVKGNERKLLLTNQKSCQAQFVVANPSPSPSAAPTPNPALAQALKDAQSELARAEGISRDFATLESAPDLQKAADASLAESGRRAREMLASARTKLDAAQKSGDLKALSEARDTATQAAAAFDAAKKQAVTLQASLRRPLQVSPGPTRTAEAPAELVQGLQAYFDGRYRDALGLLEKPSLASPQTVAAQGCLFRAAARYALFLVSAEKEEPLRTAAANDLQACRRLGITAPDPRFFSPRFLDFFNGRN